METGGCLNTELPQYHVGDDVVMKEYLGRENPWFHAWAGWRLVAVVKTCFWRFRWSEFRPFNDPEHLILTALYIKAFNEGKCRCLLKKGSETGQSPSKRLLCEETVRQRILLLE